MDAIAMEDSAKFVTQGKGDPQFGNLLRIQEVFNGNAGIVLDGKDPGLRLDPRGDMGR